MTKNLLRSFVVLLAIAASTTCAWAKVCPAPTSVTDNTVRTQPQRFSSTVNLADLIEGDTLLQGFSINFELTSDMDLQSLTITAGRCFLNTGIVPTDDMNFTVSNESSMSYTDTCGIASQALTWYPYTGTAIGDAWVVTSVEDEDALGGNTIRAVHIAGIQMPPMVWTSGTCTVSLLESSGVMTVTPTTPGVDGVMDNYSGYTSEPWTNYRTKVKSVVVEEGVTYIGQNCFGYFPNTTSLSLPAGLKVMGSNAVTSTKLTSIELPDGMQSLRGATFGGNMYLQTVTIHRIDSLVGSTFAGTSVNSVTIDSVGFMGSSMFGGVGSIRNVTIGTVGIISDYCFSSCGSSSSPGKLIIGSVGIMMQGAVSNFWGLDTIRIGVADSLCTQAFNSSGKKVFIGSIRHLGQRAFYNCNQLTEATIDNISILGKEAFYYCNNISDIYFPFTPDQITWNNPDLGFKDNKATNCHVTAASLSAWESTFPTANVTFVGDIPVPHTARMAEGTEDLEHWTITPAEATTTGVMPGSTLTATYTGTRKVKSVKAVKYVPPAATVTTAPTATAAIIEAYSSSALVNAGAANGGTMMYAVTATNAQPASTADFSATIPTAQGRMAGTYYVWYYAKADADHSDSEIAGPVSVTLAVMTTVTWNSTNVFNSAHENDKITAWQSGSLTFVGITISKPGAGLSSFKAYDDVEQTGELSCYGDNGDSFTFTAPSGKKFCKIEIIDNMGVAFTNYGDWTNDVTNNKIVWSGTAANVVTLGTVVTNAFDLNSIVFKLIDAQ